MSSDKKSTPITYDDAMGCLMRYEWPGNIRELENTIQGAIVFSNGKQITASDLPKLVTGEKKDDSPAFPVGTLAYYEFQAIILKA